MLLTRLKELRAVRGLSLRQLADKSKIPYSAISLLENGKREPQGRTVHKLAAALEVEVTELYGPDLPAPVVSQKVNDNKTITPAIKPARSTRAKRQPAPAPEPVNSFWVFEKGQEESEPFRLGTLAEAERLQDRLGGQHLARVYEAARQAGASEQHTQFLIRVVRGHDAW